jgi:hypothetical protein
MCTELSTLKLLHKFLCDPIIYPPANTPNYPSNISELRIAL